MAKLRPATTRLGLLLAETFTQSPEKPFMATPTSNSVPVYGISSSGNQSIDALLFGMKWGSHTLGVGVALTYSFPTDPAAFYSRYGSNEQFFLYPLTSSQQSAAISALDKWAEVANLTFTLSVDNVSTVGELRFAQSDVVDDEPNVAAYAYLPTGGPESGDVWFSPTRVATNVVEGGFTYLAFLHEIGHTLGLKHPFEDSPLLPTNQDFYQYTVMAYDALPGNSNAFPWRYPTTPMLYDVLAIQYLYGANMSWHTGDDTYTYSSNGEYFETIWDAGGTDTIAISGSGGGVINLRPGSFSELGQPIYYSNGTVRHDTVAIAYGANIENATGGSGSDTLQGNSLGNILIGNAGDDTIHGDAGTDILHGGPGNDTLDGGSGFDFVSYSDATSAVTVNLAITGAQAIGGGQGSDTITGVEAIFGSSYGDVLTGNSSTNYISGGDGVDILRGSAGNDTLDGGASFDFVDYSNATSAVTVSLAVAGAQNVGGGFGSDTLMGFEAIFGSPYGDVLTGNSSANYISGRDGVDILLGGAGNDTLDGGASFDFVSYADASSGVSVSLAVAGAQNVGGGLGSDTLIGIEAIFGSPYDDTLTGNSSANYISGGGGIDILRGSAGNDTLNGGASFDFVDYSDAISGVTVNLAITGAQAIGGEFGSDTLIGIEAIFGSSFGDILTGDGNANTLSGGGGADILRGGAGNDTLDGGSSFDFVSYSDAASGVTVSLAIAGPQNVGGGLGSDTLIGMEAIFGSSYGDVLTGDGNTNYLSGGSGIDILNGGAGNDTLVGGSDADTFVFDTGWGNDTIGDWQDGTDSIDLNGISGLNSFADLTVSSSASDALISFDGNLITVAGAAGHIDAGDFMFT